MGLYTHVRSPLEIKRKMLEANMKTVELKRAFYEFFLAKNGDSPDSMQSADTLWNIVETVMKIPVDNGYLLEDSTALFMNCFACLECLNRLFPEEKNNHS